MDGFFGAEIEMTEDYWIIFNDVVMSAFINEFLFDAIGNVLNEYTESRWVDDSSPYKIGVSQ